MKPIASLLAVLADDMERPGARVVAQDSSIAPAGMPAVVEIVVEPTATTEPAGEPTVTAEPAATFAPSEAGEPTAEPTVEPIAPRPHDLPIFTVATPRCRALALLVSVLG